MLRTSLGIHTITLFKTSFYDEARALLEDFKKYSLSTGEIKIHTIDESKMTYKIYYHTNDRGISWKINFYNMFANFEVYSIEATINPKILAGINDYVTAATYDDFKVASENYIVESRKISTILGDFSSYALKRIDYCINFYLPELNVNCTSEQMMELIKKGNIPPHYEEWMEYNKKSHRMKSPNDSLYLKSNSVTINSYLKYYQLKTKYPENPSLEDSLNIIRFEVQCKYLKVYNLVRKCPANDKDTKSVLLSDDFAKEVIDKYYKRVIMAGDYYTLSDAIEKVKNCCFKGKKENRMIDALKFVNQCRGISKAKQKVHPDKVMVFVQALRELSKEGINPVTIPREFGIKHIPNLLGTYHQKIKGTSFEK